MFVIYAVKTFKTANNALQIVVFNAIKIILLVLINNVSQIVLMDPIPLLLINNICVIIAQKDVNHVNNI